MIRESALAVIGMVLLLGMAILSPLCRAWVHALLGNYAAAAKIYEKRLTRHPQRLHLYVRLAALYILAGRRDERALEAYQMVWQISRAVREFMKTNPVVAQNAQRLTCRAY